MRSDHLERDPKIMPTDIRGPNLFLVGAPKCGTTSLYEYLRQHPQIYFPSAEGDRYWLAKEPCFFCPDLNMAPTASIKDKREFLQLYAGADNYKWRGDASACALRSDAAPGLIKAFCPDARILVLLRPPVEQMRSHHKQLLRVDWEDITDFHEAVAAGEDCDKGLRLPPKTSVPRSLNYSSFSCHAPQVERYFQLFGRDAVKVILLEDLEKKPKETWRELMEFLEIDTSFEPQFRIFNDAPGESRPEKWVGAIYCHPAVNPWARRLIPYGARRRFLSAVRAAHANSEAPDPRDEALRERCKPDVQRLAALIGRDLSHWV